jgi:cysteine desulfurase
MDAPRTIYLDHAATTPLDPRIAVQMRPFLAAEYGNEASPHFLGRRAHAAVEAARAEVAGLIGAEPEEIVFTGSGSEADNLALKGVALYHKLQDVHVVTTGIEHDAVRKAAQSLARLGVEVTIVPVDGCGRVDPDQVRHALRTTTRIVSVMHANNEVGTLEPVAEIGAIAREHGVTFHVDAVQTAGLLPIDVDALACDLLTLSAHKFYGPKGVGALYVRRETRLVPLVDGGPHEGGLRAGTLNVAGIVGMGEAARLVRSERDARRAHALAVRETLAAALAAALPEAKRSGHPAPTLPGHLHLRTRLGPSRPLLAHLSERGIAAASGSACTAAIDKPSHVLTAMGVPAAEALSALRLTTGQGIELADVPVVVAAIAEYAGRASRAECSPAR